MSDLVTVVRKYCPLVVFHPKEKFLCCTPEFYVDAATMVQVSDTGDPKITKTILEKEQTTFGRVTGITSHVALSAGYRLALGDNTAARVGQVDEKLRDIPVFCHLKRVKLTSKTLLELNYIFCLAYSGPYSVAGIRTGAHEGDWEHITVRCTTDGKLVGVYYSAHRHGDGTWVAPKDVPVDPATGRLLCFVSVNGHGVYPTTGVHPRVFLLANDVTSPKGRRWGCAQCIVLTPPGSPLIAGLTVDKLPEVEDRGAKLTVPYDGQLKQFTRLPGASGGRDDGPVNVADIQVSVPETEWLKWRVRWGTVVPPQYQKWYIDAEHPTGSTATKRTVTPCVRN